MQRHNPPLVPGVHPETIPVRMTYKRIAAFVYQDAAGNNMTYYDGVNAQAQEKCYGSNYSWGFGLRRAPAVVLGAPTDNIGCPLAPQRVPPAVVVVAGRPPQLQPVLALSMPTILYVAITVAPRVGLTPDQTLLSADFIRLHNSRERGGGHENAAQGKLTDKQESEDFKEIRKATNSSTLTWA